MEEGNKVTLAKSFIKLADSAIKKQDGFHLGFTDAQFQKRPVSIKNVSFSKS